MIKAVLKWFLLGIIICGFISCSKDEDVEQYSKYINKIISIIKTNKHNTDMAGDAVLKYVTDNQTAIETTLKNLAAYTVEQTRAQYNRLMQPVNKLRDLLAMPQTMYPESIRISVNALLKENQAAIDENSTLLQENSSYFMRSAFTDLVARLGVLKEFAAETPPSGFALSANENFITAVQILKCDNLVLSQ